MHAVVKGNSAPYPSASPPYTSYPLLSRPVPFIPRDGTGQDGIGTGFSKWDGIVPTLVTCVWRWSEIV